MFRRRFCYRNFNYRTISFNEFMNLMKENKIILIDVRSKQEYEEGHYDGAINIPLYAIKNDIENFVDEKSSVIVVYCSTGQRSRKAQAILSSMGYSNVYNLI